MNAILFWLSLIAVAAQLAILARAILRPHREPASRLAWVIVIVVIPVVGMLAYLLLGEARISAKRRALGRRIDENLCRPPVDEKASEDLAASAYAAPFALARSVNNLMPSSGNAAQLPADSNAAIDAMVADIDGASATVHICFYIWLSDTNGLKLRDAVVRAARRGVAVRILVDALGSRAFIRSPHWHAMRDAGADCREALPVGNLLWTMIRGRVDLRNHRKALLVDNRIGWCGSQNAADPEFRIKPRFAPWVDIMTRWEGDVVRDMQFVFVGDWLAEAGEDLSDLLLSPPNPHSGPVLAQVIATGPSHRVPEMSACFATLIHSAREEVIITTPYFVPDEQVLTAIVTAALRGVHTVLVLPERCDNRLVKAAGRSHYREMLRAGVKVHEFRPGLLHAKTVIVDRTVGLVGSANMDRRSFELNFENNVMFLDPAFAAEVRQRQDEYIAASRSVDLAEVERTSMPVRLWRNALAMMAPLL